MEKFEKEDVLIDQIERNPIYKGRQVYRGEPVFCSEYGGIKWDTETKKNNYNESWGYGDAPKTKEEFVERFEGLTNAIMNNSKIMGLCYTQLYDVEQEKNGLYTYDRKPKFNMNIFKEILSRKAKIEE